MAYNVENTETTIQTQLDVTDSILIIPATKLDADQYAAEDIDGVTESLFGSGNMAYGALQASLTNVEMSNADPFLYDSNFSPDNISVGNLNIGNTGDAPFIKSAAEESLRGGNQNNGDFTSTDRGIEAPLNIATNSGDGNFSAGTVGSVSASQLSSDAGTFAPSVSGLSLGSGLNGRSGISGSSGNNGNDGRSATSTNGTDGQNGTNGQDGDGGGKTIIDVDIGDTIINFGDLNIDLGDFTEIIDGLFIDLGDTIVTLTTEVNNTLNILGDIITNIDILDLSNVTVLVTNITNNLTDIVNNTVTEITNITTNIKNIINNILDGDGLGDLTLLLDLNVLDTVLTDVTVPLNDILATDVNLDIDLNPAYEFLNNIADLTGLDILSDALGELGGTVDSLQGTIDQLTDLVTDLDLKDPGATVEQLVDTLTNLNDNVAGITDEIDNTVGDILDAIGLAGDDAGGEGLISQTLDPVVNDIGNVLDDLTGGATDGLTENLDNAVDSVTDLADDLTGGLTGGLLGQNNNYPNGDSDLVVDLGIDPLGIDETIDAALDPVEDLIGDIDLGIDLDTDLLGGNGDEIDNNAGDSDITVQTGIDIVDNTLLGEGLDVPLDPLEQITGDIDLDINLAADLLGDLADPLLNNGEGGTGEDTLVAGIGDALGDTVDGILDGDLGDDPAGDIVDAIGLGDNDEIISDIVDPLVEGVGDILDGATDGATAELTDGLEDTVDGVSDIADDLVGGLGDALMGDDNGGEQGLISDTLDPVLNDIGNVLDDLTGGASEELTSGLDDAVDGLTDFADNLTEGLTGGILGLNNDNQDGAGDSDITADLGIEALGIDEPIEAALDPVEDLVGDVDLDLGLDADLLGLGGSETDDAVGDSDITLETGIDLADDGLLNDGLEISLDPVEELVGDVDLDLNLGSDLLGDIADPLVNNGEGGTGEDTLLSELGDGLGDVGDGVTDILGMDEDSDLLDNVLDPVQDVVDGLGLGGEDGGIVDDLADASLSLIDDITGGFDQDLGGALDLLNTNNSDGSDESSGGDDSSWTESTIGDGGLFDDLVDGLGGAGDVLPDPTGTIAEGLGVLDIEPEIDVGSLGGLFG